MNLWEIQQQQKKNNLKSFVQKRRIDGEKQQNKVVSCLREVMLDGKTVIQRAVKLGYITIKLVYNEFSVITNT